MKRWFLFPATLLLALFLTAFSGWMLNNHLWNGSSGLMLAQAWAGVLVVLVLGYASGALWQQRVESTPVLASVAGQGSGRLLAFIRVAIWSACWMVVWAFLPAGGLLKLMSGVVFFALAWAAKADGLFPFTAPKTASRLDMLTVLVAVLLLMVFSYMGHPFRMQRLIADFAGPLDLQGRHYVHGQVLKALWTLRAFEAADVALPASLSRSKGLEILSLASR